jgi:phage antirepressor YoqD-like protein
LQNETEEEKELNSEKRKKTTELEVVQPKALFEQGVLPSAPSQAFPHNY